MTGVAGQVAIVTGGASGIGRALCEELVRRHAVVIVADLNGEEARRVARALAAAGGSASAERVDVARAESLAGLVRRTLAKHGRIDLLFNNAGIGWSGEFQEMATAQSDRLVDINLNGVLHGVAAVYPIMIEQGAGHIINTSSFFSGLIPIPGKSVYSATKHAIVGFSLSLREEARLFGVKVSVICPSFIRSNIDENSARILRGQDGSTTTPLPGASADAMKLARSILDGVSRNRAIIIRPSFIRPFWWLYRLSPGFFFRLQSPVVMRKLRREPASRLVSSGFLPARWLFRLLLGRGRRN
jgi:NAD(P)-dependent dehydrogenase (short-subunit alcohol dehydrogenase family)